MSEQYSFTWRKRFEWMTDAQFECFEFLCWIYRGAHHVQTSRIKPCGDDGIEINTSYTGQFATFDFNGLTRAVVYAHDKAIRFCIESSGPGMLRLFVHKRQRDGEFHERHPTLEAHAADIRKTIKEQAHD